MISLLGAAGWTVRVTQGVVLPVLDRKRVLFSMSLLVL
jgi:hypothetical protein